jgi:putative ABC transport system permease protein
MPVFRNISGKDLTIGFLMNPFLLMGLFGLILVISLVGGSYPAFFLSAFRPVEVMQGKLRRGAKNSVMRIALVTLQFTVSIVLIIGTLVVSRQLNYIKNRNLGYEKDHVIMVKMKNPATQKNYEAIKSVYRQHPDVLKVSGSATSPHGWNDFRAEHAVGKPDNEYFMMFAQFIDEDFLDLYDIKIIEGRDFSKEFPADPKESIIINETTMKKLGWQENPINQEIEVGLTSKGEKRRYKIIGVVQDYHFQSLHEEISPLVLFNSCLHGNFNQISIRIKSENIQDTLGFLESKWQEFDSKFPFEYSFVDEQFDVLYRTEERLGQLFGYFTLLAVFIGCLGLFGLTSFAAEQRTKEIGIRKVLGASVPGIIMLLVREFTKWVLLAVIVAWPVGYFVMKNWLQNFAYRTSLAWDTFLLAAALALVISIITVSYQAVKAAVADPVTALKYE